LECIPKKTRWGAEKGHNYTFGELNDDTHGIINRGEITQGEKHWGEK